VGCVCGVVFVCGLDYIEMIVMMEIMEIVLNEKEDKEGDKSS
jgi:hypothetical protein